MQPSPRPDVLNPEEFERFRALIYKWSGIQLSPKKAVLVSNRILRRLKATGIADFSSYYKLLNSAQACNEISKFLDEITTNETFFFRDRYQFDWFSHEFLPTALGLGLKENRSRQSPLRIWSAACSTGEETYSIAICLHEAGVKVGNESIELLGTDLSSSALKSAAEGTFRDRSLRNLRDDEISRFFLPNLDGTLWSIRPEIGAIPSWKRHNLMGPLSSRSFDCVFLKNVLIYFDLQSKRSVVQHVLNRLVPGAYLVLGPTEGVMNMLEPLERIKPWLYRMPEANSTATEYRRP